MPETSPLSHLIAGGLLAWLAAALRRAAGGPELRGARLLVVGSLLAWAVASSWLAYRGAYLALNASHLLLVWATAAPYALVGALALASAKVRELLRRFARGVSLESLTAVHAVRVLALGTLTKWWIGALPGHFILPVGVPDFLIGLTALPVSRWLARQPVAKPGLLAAWHAVGAGVLLLAVPLIQLSQPGPLRVFTEGPRTDEVLDFPMSIVPTFVAPLLVGLHAVALLKLARQRAPAARREEVP
ncbi:MAG: hypothetical protein V3U03_15250 [Myxococcota bacterium]